MTAKEAAAIVRQVRRRKELEGFEPLKFTCIKKDSSSVVELHGGETIKGFLLLRCSISPDDLNYI